MEFPLQLDSDCCGVLDKCYICFVFFSDRTIPNLDTLVPFDSTKAYDILDVIYPVSNKDGMAAQHSKSSYWLQCLSFDFQVLRILLIG